MKDKKNVSKPLVVAQFSDCHLFSNTSALHLGANVWQNLTGVLAELAKNKNIDLIIFTGDLTQDHSVKSYQLFLQTVANAKLSAKIYYLAGNHDEPTLLNKYLTGSCFSVDKTITDQHWQIQLIDSKSTTPSGLVTTASFTKLNQAINKSKHQLILMHHHPVDIGYYIDNHGLLEQNTFWQTMNELNTANDNCIKAIACGHVHRASFIAKGTKRADQSLDVYTCGATSVQFGDTKESVSSTMASYRLFYLYSNGEIDSHVNQLCS